MKEEQSRGSSIWMNGYVNVGEKVGKIRKFRFTQMIRYSNTCPGECNAISLANIMLQCEKPDHHTLSTTECKDKQTTLSSCLIDVFKPFKRGINPFFCCCKFCCMQGLKFSKRLYYSLQKYILSKSSKCCIQSLFLIKH